MIPPHSDFRFSEPQQISLKKRLPPGETFFCTHWPYYLHLMRETGRSERTLTNVRSCVRTFLLHTDLISLESWKNGSVVQKTFLRMKAERNWSNVTYNSYRKGLLSYFQALEDADLIAKNPIRKVRKCPEVPKDQPKFDKAQIGPLFHHLSNHQKGTPYFLFYRNYLFFLLAYYTGARPVEILSLTLNSFSSDRTVIRIVSAKGSGKTRVFKLGSQVGKALHDYIRECAFIGRSGELEHHFFLGNRQGRSWTYPGIRQVCKQVSKKVDFRVTPYMFRRLVATEMFARKITLQNIQHHLGHTRASTTLRYVQGEHNMNSEGMAAMAQLIGHSHSYPTAHTTHSN